MERYECTEGNSKKFWEIELNDCTVTTNYGRIGAKGTTTIKEFDSKKEAQKNYDKLVQEKTKKGYVCVSENKPPTNTSTELINAEIERALQLEPHNERLFLDYGVWQQRNGLARGELSMLFHPKPPSQEKLKTLIGKHAKELVGLFAEEKVNHRVADPKETQPLEIASPYQASPIFFDWYFGYIRSARLAVTYDNQQKWSDQSILETYLNLESAKFTRYLTLGLMSYEGDNSYNDMLYTLSKTKKIPHLEGLFVGNFESDECEISWSHLGDAGPLTKSFPKLKTLILRGGDIELSCLEAPELRRLVMITGGLPKEALKGLKKPNCPKLEHLEIYVGTEDYGRTCEPKDFEFLENKENFKNLKYLGIKNAQNAKNIIKKIMHFDLLQQLETLDFSMGTLSDKEADLFLENKNLFKKLKLLDLSNNFFFESDKKFENFPCTVRLQTNKDTYYDELYVSIGE